MNITRLESTGGRPYASATVAEGRFVFVSGQIPLRDGELFRGTMGEQTDVVLENIQAILKSAGLTLADVVRCGVFLSDLSELPEFNAAYTAAFGAALPARSTVGVTLPGYKVEIDCIAVVA